MKAYDLTNQKFHFLTVIKRIENRVEKNGKQRAQWLCKCDCGNYHASTTYLLTSGSVKSCGCFKFASRNSTHGLTKTRLHQIWSHMRKRCNCKTDKNYSNYGGRGIKICDEWNDFLNFYNWSMENGYEEHLTIDRIDVNGNYEPSNCRWISFEEQQRNKTNNLFIFNKDKKILLVDFCRQHNLDYEHTRVLYHKLVKSNIEPSFENLLVQRKFTVSNRRKIRNYSPILQIDLQGNVIREWNNYTEIKFETNYNTNAIKNCCYGKAKTSAGYVWKYKYPLNYQSTNCF